MNGAFAELLLLSAVIGGPALIAIGLEWRDDRRIRRSVDAQLAAHRDMYPWLRRQAAKGAYVAGVCVGAAYLAEAGLLDGREATTHWASAPELQRRYPAVKWRPDKMMTEDRRVLCSGGVYASIDLSLYLVEKFCGHEIAVQKTARCPTSSNQSQSM